jgi:hypothetical protein
VGERPGRRSQDARSGLDELQASGGSRSDAVPLLHLGLGESSEHALELIEKIVQEAACPVIVLIHTPDPDFIKEASKRGVFAYITDADAKDWQNSIDIVLRRFAEGRQTAADRRPQGVSSLDSTMLAVLIRGLGEVVAAGGHLAVIRPTRRFGGCSCSPGSATPSQHLPAWMRPWRASRCGTSATSHKSSLSKRPRRIMSPSIPISRIVLHRGRS